MKEKSNATLRRAASLRCRTDAAIARLGRAVAYSPKGAITTAELLREASAAADRAGTLELSVAELAATGSFGRSVNRKVKAPRLCPHRCPHRHGFQIGRGLPPQGAGACPHGGKAWKPADGPHRPRPYLGRCRRSAQRGRVRRLRGLRDALKYPRLTMARWPRAETPRASREARNIFEIREASP